MSWSNTCTRGEPPDGLAQQGRALRSERPLVALQDDWSSS